MKLRSVQWGRDGSRRCPCIGVLCFLCALLGSLFSSKTASADAPPRAIQSSSFAAPAAVLGLSNPYLIAAAAGTPVLSSEAAPRIRGFTFSQNLLDLAAQVQHLARFGVELNQRKLPRSEKLNLRVNPRFGGGVLQLCYRR